MANNTKGAWAMSVPMIDTEINGRWNIKLPKHRADRPEWNIKNGGWEKARLDAFYDTVQRIKSEIGGQELDTYYVGAEEGDMCGLISSWGSKVTMFEPNDKVMPNIKAIWDANGLEDTAFFAGFASDKTTDNWEDGLNKVSEIIGEVIGDHGFKELRDADVLPQVTIDDYVGLVGDTPDIISMDVEGSEGRVLRGAEQTLRTYKPVLFISMHPEFLITQYNEWTAELRRWIKDLGYNEVLLDYQHEIHFLYTPKENQ